MSFWGFLRSACTDLDQLGQDPIPEDVLPGALPGRTTHSPPENDDAPELSIFPDALLEEMPLFLRNSVTGLVGLPSFSIRDVFWTGGLRQPFHPLLANSYFVIVNRRMKRPVHWPLSRPWKIPLCLILRRVETSHCVLYTSQTYI